MLMNTMAEVIGTVHYKSTICLETPMSKICLISLPFYSDLMSPKGGRDQRRVSWWLLSSLFRGVLPQSSMSSAHLRGGLPLVRLLPT